MKKIKFFAFSILLLSFIITPVAYARVAVTNAEVLGKVKDCDTKLPHVNVTATCGGQTLSGSTGSTGGDLGKYSITFYGNASCVNGSLVTVTALVGGNNYTNTGTIGTYFPILFSDKAKVDIQTNSNCGEPTVPEFGLLTGALAALGSAGSYLLLKKRSIKG